MASAGKNSSDLSSVWRIVRLLAVFIYMPTIQTVHAGSATWSQNPANGDWNEPSNWVPATVPNGPADTAAFGTSNLTSVSISNNDGYEQVSGITFNIGASPFMITVAEPAGGQGFVLIISGTGIVNNSGIIQNFVSNSAFNGHGQFLFENNSTAGSTTVFTNNGASVRTFDPFIAGTAFIDTSSAGSGTFINNPGSADAIPGFVSFEDNATASHGRFVNNGATVSPGQFYNGGYTSFQGTTTAANATFTNNGGLANHTLGGFAGFYDSSTAGNGTFTNNPGEVSGLAGAARCSSITRVQTTASLRMKVVHSAIKWVVTSRSGITPVRGRARS
jgi:hypothetical protein